MARRKTPILLRRGPVSGRVMALTNYRIDEKLGVARVIADGKHEVTGDFYELMLRELIDGADHCGDHREGTPDIVAILDGAADGEELSDEHRAQLREFRERLRDIVVAHNERIDARKVAA